MSVVFGCDHSRLPYVGGIVVGCMTCRDAGFGPVDHSVRGRGWRCKSCGWAQIAPERWEDHLRSDNHVQAVDALNRRAALQSQLSSLTREVEIARTERQKVRALTAEELTRREAEANTEILARTQAARSELAEARGTLSRVRAEIAQERAVLEAVRAKAKEVSGFADAEAKTRAAAEEERRKTEEAGREEKEKAERRAAEIDRRLLAGEAPKEIHYSADLTEAQVRHRQLALAKMKENRGRPWAEKAIDGEIVRLLEAGVRRDEIKSLLKVGASRIRRVERVRSGTGSGPAWDRSAA